MGGTSVLSVSDLGDEEEEEEEGKNIIVPHVKTSSVPSYVDIFRPLNLDVAIMEAKQS